MMLKKKVSPVLVVLILMLVGIIGYYIGVLGIAA